MESCLLALQSEQSAYKSRTLSTQIVEVMRSDNGTNLVATEHEIRWAMKEWNQSQISEAVLQRGVTWIFNPPAGSHHCGIWERQIRTVRKILTNLLKLQSLNDECLQTVMCEVEAVINSRALTIHLMTWTTSSH